MAKKVVLKDGHHMPEDVNLPSRLPAKISSQLLKEKIEFIKWVHQSIKTKSMRRFALEQGAFFFINERYDRLIEVYRGRIEKLLSFKQNLLKRHMDFQMQQENDYRNFQLSMAEITQRKASKIHSINQLLNPPSNEKNELEKMYAEDKKELIKLKLQQKKRRFIRQSIAADAAEKAKLRAEFIAQVRKDVGDPDLQHQAIDDYDRFLYELGG